VGSTTFIDPSRDFSPQPDVSASTHAANSSLDRRRRTADSTSIGRITRSIALARK
jgi:hypothetical protein